MVILILVVCGAALLFAGFFVISAALAKTRHAQTRQHARECARFGAHSLPWWLKEKFQQDQFRDEMVAVAIHAGLTKNEATTWIDREGLLSGLMTIAAVFDKRSASGTVQMREATEFAKEEARLWVVLHRGQKPATTCTR